jgi:thiol:disulfide interchange protein DsbA
MRFLRYALATVSLVATTALASPADPKSGVDYVTLSTPQPAPMVGKKVEVIEFFAYHCPACNALEPELHAWVKQQGDNINFKRIPFPFTGPNDPEAHLYLTLEAMGLTEQMNARVFRAFHVERQRLTRDDVIIDWVAKQGVDKAKFLSYWNSFGVKTKLKRLPVLVSSYKISGVPSLVVDGRFMTSPSLVNEKNPGLAPSQVVPGTFKVMETLVSRVQKEKGAAPAGK